VRTEVRLGRAQVVPVGLPFDAVASSRDKVALDAEQLLDDALTLFTRPTTSATSAVDRASCNRMLESSAKPKPANRAAAADQ